MLKKLPTGICLCLLFFFLHAQNDEIIGFEQDSQDSVLQQSEIPYQWVSYRAKLSIETGEQVKNCQLFIVNRIDSILYVNLNIGGIELARAVFTPTEMIFVNKMEKSYYRGNYGFLQTVVGIPLDFALLQSLLNGIEIDQKLLEEIDVEIEYNNYATFDNYIFFQNFRFETSEIVLEADLKNIKFNTPGPTAITIPDSFKEIMN